MTVKELKEYLNEFQNDSEVRFSAADLKKSIGWSSNQTNAMCFNNFPFPLIVIVLHEREGLYKEAMRILERNEKEV